MSDRRNIPNHFNDILLGRLDGISLRKLAEEDLDAVLNWRNHDDVRLQMFNQNRITYDEHRRWFAHLNSRDDELQLLVCHKGKKIGISNIKTANGMPITQSTALELGLYIGIAEVRGSLLSFVPAMHTIDFCFNELKATSLYARVKNSNHAALRFNQQLGYVITEKKEFIRMDLTRDQYVVATQPLQRLRTL